MAFIVGLDEQKAALTRVKHNLSEVKKINESLSNLKGYITEAKTKEYKIECEFVLPDGELKRIKIPAVIENNDFLFDSLKKYKDDIVKQIKDDSSKYHISLSPQEEAVLFGENNSGN